MNSCVCNEPCSRSLRRKSIKLSHIITSSRRASISTLIIWFRSGLSLSGLDSSCQNSGGLGRTGEGADPNCTRHVLHLQFVWRIWTLFKIKRRHSSALTTWWPVPSASPPPEQRTFSLLTCLEGPESGPSQHKEARPPWRPGPSAHQLRDLWSAHS